MTSMCVNMYVQGLQDLHDLHTLILHCARCRQSSQGRASSHKVQPLPPVSIT